METILCKEFVQAHLCVAFRLTEVCARSVSCGNCSHLLPRKRRSPKGYKEVRGQRSECCARGRVGRFRDCGTNSTCRDRSSSRSFGTSGTAQASCCQPVSGWMRAGLPKQALVLTEEGKERPESLAHRARSEPALPRRARAVLACATGSTINPWRKSCGARWVWWASGGRGFSRCAWKGSPTSRGAAQSQ